MKILIYSFLTLFTLVSYGQENPATKSGSQNEPIFFLDSVRISKDQMHFDPNKIEKIDVVKGYDPMNKSSGAIFIKSKDPREFNFLTAAQVQNTFAKGITAPVIFMLDNEFLKDIAAFKIDSSYILKVELIKGSGIAYLKNILPGLTILKIITRTKENTDRINLRGTETTSY